MKSRVPIRAMPWVVAVMLMLAALPAAAQEETPPDDATAEVTAPTDEAPSPSVEDAPVDVVAPASTAPAPVRNAVPVLDMSNRVASYVQSVRTLPGTLFVQENRLDGWLQNYRLGAIPRARLETAMPQAADGMVKLETLWQQIIPPPNLLTVHNYAEAAVSETHTGVQITVDNFMAGGGSIPPSAAAHFAQSDRLVAAALLAIDAAAGP